MARHDRGISPGSPIASQQPGGLFLRRAAAYSLDIVLLFAILAPLGFLLGPLLGSIPETGPEIWRRLLLNFSLPTWLYFILFEGSPRGATLGKRLLRLQVRRLDGRALGIGPALRRTALKLLPWELLHLSIFGLSAQPGDLDLIQSLGLAVAFLLWGLYLVSAVTSGGRRARYDDWIGSQIQRSLPPTVA